MNNTDSGPYQIEFSPDSEPATRVLVRGLADVLEAKPMNLSPLEETIPCDALNLIVADGDDVTLRFSYAELRISIDADGQIVIRGPKVG